MSQVESSVPKLTIARNSDDRNSDEVIERFSYDDDIVRMFVTATIIWGLVATLIGLLIAVLLTLPELSTGLPWFSFGRLRPLHTNAAIFAFVGNAVFAAIYYSTQRLCKARMWSNEFSRLHFWGWQAIIVAAAITLPAGITQSREFAELEYPIDIALAFVWLIFGANFFMTLINRRERHLYVALWFYIATIVTVTLLHIFNNLVLPTSWVHSYPIYAGVQDALMQWWYGHNLMAFLLVMPFLGMMYYFLPKAAERPVYSYKLSIVHFWSLILICIWAGPHHLHYTSLPEWASTLGMLFSLMLWMPSWGGMINGLLTLRGAWHKVATDPVLKFYVVGVLFYGMSTLESSLLSIKSINALSQYTDWTIAHIHASALGWNGFMTFGMIYWLLPRLYQTKLWSTKLMSAHFYVGLLGIGLYILPIYAAGALEGLMWREMDDKGNLTYEFSEATQSVLWLWWLRSAGGALYVFGIVMLGVNTLMTWVSRPNKYEVPILQAPRLRADYVDPVPDLPNELKDAAVLEFGKKLNMWSKLAWHRRWERLPVRFTLLVTFIIVVATLFEVIPTFLIRSNIPTIASVKPYTPLELAGRQIYVSEGCYNCHTQQVRPLVAETRRYGEYSKAGEFVYDRPFQWGSRRIGPDLAREGGKQSSAWHWAHFEKPSELSTDSIMPSYEHLIYDDLNFTLIPQLVEAADKLGGGYTEDQLGENAVKHAHQQAEVIVADMVKQGGPAGVFEKKGVALIAYLQRLGTDAFRAPEAPKPAASKSTEPTETEPTEKVPETPKP